MVYSLTLIVWFLVAICLLVAIHEFGHFIVARACGVKVLRFSIGFGKRLLTKTDARGTEFALSAIPLGGYVKMLDEREGDVSPEERHLSYNSKGVWQRIAIAAAGPAANFILAIALYWLIFLQGTTSLSPTVGKIAEGSIAAQAGLEVGQEILAIDGEPTDSRRAMTLYLLNRLGESGDILFSYKYPDSDFTYESAATLDNWLRGEENPDPIAGLGISFYAPPFPPVSLVEEGLPAANAGFEVGDQITAADGQPMDAWGEWVAYVRARPLQSIAVTVKRQNGESVVLDLLPNEKSAGGETIGYVGMGAAHEPYPESMIRRYRYGVVGAFAKASEETWETSGFVLLSLKKLIIGEISRKNLSGPIGIAKVAADHAEHGFWAFLSFLAHLSVLLGVMNLLPIPVLDGGHIVYCLVEWIKGSPVSEKVQVLGFQVGLAMVLGVMVIAFYNDILRL